MRCTASRHGKLPVALLLLAAGAAAASGAAGPPGRPGSGPGDAPARPAAIPAEQARAEFEAICRRVRESDEPYHGQKPLFEAAKRLAAGPTGRAAIEVRVQLGQELLKQHRPRKSVAILTEALERVRWSGIDGPLRDHVVYNLALAHLRAGEDANCVQHHTLASCIYPIAEAGIHGQPAHARQAGDLLLSLLPGSQISPRTIHYAWLLNIARMVSGDYPEGVPDLYRLPPTAFESAEPFPAWTDRSIPLGVNVVDLAGGAIMDDFDSDGLLDLVSSTSDPCGSLKAFRNDGRGGFEDVTASWGLDSQLGGLNLVHADYDGDGRLDLLVLRGAWLHTQGRMRNSLLRNELGGPRGRFVDVSKSTGVGLTEAPTQTAAWADYDGDGDLDLYVGNESHAEDPYPSELYRNNGDGTFTDVSSAAGVSNDRYAKAVTWGDFDDDGDPDLFVSNLGPNRLYRNDGDGTFHDVAPEVGVVEPSDRSFTSWFFDYDNDGDLDLFVSDYGSVASDISMSYYEMPNVKRGQPLLYRNDDGKFVEVSREMGIRRPGLPMGANYGDLDNDGWLDFYLGTGDPLYETVMPNQMYRNREGQMFVDVTFAGRFGHLQKGHGVAFGDVDNDGDQDLFHQLGGFYPGDAFGNALFENPGNDHRWITLRLEGRKANRLGVGARIEVRVREATAETGDARGGPRGTRSIHVLAGSGGSFGGSSMQQEIGLGSAAEIDEIIVRWPGSGTVQRFRDVEPDRFYRVIEGEDRLVPLSPPELSLASGSTSRPGRR